MPQLPVIGTDRQFAIVREYLRNCAFTFPNVLQRLHAKSPCDVRQFLPEPSASEPRDEQEMLARLFVRGDTVSARHLTRIMPTKERAAMTALGLLAPCPEAPGDVFSPVALCPVEDIFVACDRWSVPRNGPFRPTADSVYSPLTLTTQRFVDGIFRGTCENVLDLCSGSGVAALLAGAHFAQRAVAADITKRSLRFAEFNRRLNGLENVSIVHSDIYSGVKGQRFDRVLAHPPYVPVLRPKWIYHDGGADGEQITRRIIAGLPRFLRPGGSFHCHALATDRDQPLEQRIRGWLGKSEAQFDIVLVIWNLLQPMEWAKEAVARDGRKKDLDTWKQLFRKWHVNRLLDVSITIARHDQEPSPIDVRRLGGEGSRADEIEWLLRWERSSSSNRTRSWLRQVKPRIAKGVRIHRASKGTWKVRAEYPFVVSFEVHPWIRRLLGLCNGRRSGAELYETMRRKQQIDVNVSRDEFADALAELVSYGFVVVPECKPRSPKNK